MTALYNKIYMNGGWPKDFLDVTKENQAKKCSDHRKINLMHCLTDSYNLWNITVIYFLKVIT